MNIRKIFVVLASLILSTAAMAQTITPVFDAEAKTISILVDTEFECWGVGFKIYLPEGVIVPEYENDDEDMVPNIVKGSRAKSSATLDIKNPTAGYYSLNLFGAAFKSDKTQPVIVITLDGDLKGEIDFKDIAFTDKEAVSYLQDDFKLDITPAAPTEVGKIDMVVDFVAGEPYAEQQKDIPAAGGKDKAVSKVTYAVVTRTFWSDGTYTDGEKSETMEAYIYGEETADIPSLGTNVTERTKVGTSTPKGALKNADGVAYKAETTDITKAADFEATAASLDIYQEANTATYQDVIITTTQESFDMNGDGDSYDLANAIATSQSITYTSGASKDGQVTVAYTVKNQVEGYSLEGSVVAVTINPTSEVRNGFVVTATATGEGQKSASIDITFNQPVSTAISTVKAAMSEGKIYDINGRAVNTTFDNLSKGVYIINNRKYIVK